MQPRQSLRHGVSMISLIEQIRLGSIWVPGDAPTAENEAVKYCWYRS